MLTATFTTDAPWLRTYPCLTFPPRTIPNCRWVGVDKSNLGRGHYTGVITITGAPGSHTQDSPQRILVDLWMAQGYPPGYKMSICLPVVMK